MPQNNERPCSTSSSDAESSESCASTATSSDLDSSRNSFSSDSSSKHCTPSSSPPKVLSLNEVMEAGKDLFNLKIAHELVMNKDFHMEPNLNSPNSLWETVKTNVHKAYWDILESELNNDPPEYQHAIKLLEEIREILLSFLNPGANRMQTQIMEVLDMDLIRHQADNDAVDIQGLASYIITTMGKMCAPIRDKEIKNLRELNTDNTVTLFREIFRVLDLMKIDEINNQIRNLNPILQMFGAEYERETFQKVLDKTPSALNKTTSWIQSALEELLSTSVPTEKSSDSEKGFGAVPGPFQVLNTAFFHILKWDFSKSPVPETWVTGELRLQMVQWQLKQCEAVNEVLLNLFSTVGEQVQGVASLSNRLKRMISVLLDGMHKKEFNLKEALEGVSAQVCCELNKSLTERNYPALTPELQATLTGQICSISQKDNPIRTLVEDRVQQYFMGVLSDPKPLVKLEDVPAGLAAVKPELVLIGKTFLSLVNYNKAVYGPFYANIIRKLLFSNAPPPESPPQEPAQNSLS